jgi:hypothetical protein
METEKAQDQKTPEKPAPTSERLAEIRGKREKQFEAIKPFFVNNPDLLEQLACAVISESWLVAIGWQFKESPDAEHDLHQYVRISNRYPRGVEGVDISNTFDNMRDSYLNRYFPNRVTEKKVACPKCEHEFSTEAKAMH